MYLIIKVVATALIVVGISELARRFSLFAAILASLPLTSILAMIWIYIETKSVEKITELSHGIFWMVLPSLLFFVVLPILLKLNVKFPLALLISSAIVAVVYSGYIYVLNRVGITV